MNETKNLYNHELKQARDACGVTKEDMENTFNKIRETLISSEKTSQFVEKMEELRKAAGGFDEKFL